MPSLADYLALIPSANRDKSRFVATVSAVVAPQTEITALMEGLPALFDVDEAVATPLDLTGEWIGRTRSIAVPLDVYFSLGVDGLGIGQGVWKGPYDADSGLTDLPDDQYRLLLRAKIAANGWDGGIPGAYAAYDTIFDGSGTRIGLQDNQDMSLTVIVAGTRPDALTTALITGGYIPLKPGGVRVAGYAVVTVSGPAFGLGAHNEVLAGFGSGAWADVVTPT